MPDSHDGDTSVAHLVFQHTSLPQRVYPIYSQDEFDLGREHVRRAWDIHELSISTHHLRFRCVIFESEKEQMIAPLVYVHVLSRNPVILGCSDFNNPCAEFGVTQSSGDVLLQHNNHLQLTPEIRLLFQAVKYDEGPANNLDAIRRAEIKHFDKQYQVTGRVLGAGGHASVCLAVKRSTRRQIACKIISLPQTRLKKLPNNELLKNTDVKTQEQHLLKKRKDLAREYDILKDLDHPNIVCLEKVFCASYNIYIFQELITGGDLMSYLEKEGALGEPQSAVITRQIVKAVEHLHLNSIVHRDIKPENVLMTSWRKGGRVVLTDFGQARTLESGSGGAGISAVFRMQTFVGTYGYTAPEVFQQPNHHLLQEKGYSKAIDIWSVGCLTATLLTDNLILTEKHQHSRAENARAATPKQCTLCDLGVLETGIEWQSIGRRAKLFVRACLNVDETARPTAQQALLHEWFTNKDYGPEIEAAYQRAIHGWAPRGKVGNLIEFVNTTDAALVEARSGRVRQPADNIVSPHFRTPPGLRPQTASKHTYLQFSKRRPTQRSPISEEDESFTTHPLHSNPIVEQSATYTYSSCVPDSPVREKQSLRSTIKPSSISVYRPPQIQFSLNGTLPPPPPDWQDITTQLEPTLEDVAPKKVRVDELHARCKKRTVGVVDIDALEGGQVISEQLGEGSALPVPPERKKVHR